MNRFISNTGPEADGILLCGPSCIGKSYFHKSHKFYKYHSNQSKTCFIFEKGKYNDASNTYCVHVARTRRISSLWEVLFHPHIITKKAIILGVPYKIWQERIKNRVLAESKRANCNSIPKQRARSFVEPAGIDKFKEIYVKWIEELNKNNIPYVFVDNRNDSDHDGDFACDYPILDESSFMTMLQDEPI